MNHLSVLLASGFGSGFVRPGSGTWGSLVGCLIVYGVFILAPPEYYNWILVVVFLASVLLGMGAIMNLPDHWIHDDQRIVIDEIAGMILTVLFIPFSMRNLFIAFLVFRVFDIAKPLGIRALDRMKSDWGVMLDDLLAGVYANLTIRLIFLLLIAI